MKYGKVKEYEVSRVVLGTGSYGLSISDADGEELLKTYIEKGGNAIDTGNAYMNWVPGNVRSSSEKWLGKMLKANPGMREKLIICTKGAHYETSDPRQTPRVNEGCITYDVEDSRKNMGVDKIDLYWLHRDNPTYPVYLIMDALFAAQDAGKIGHFGASNWSARRIIEANRYADSCNREGFFGSQTRFSFAIPLDAGGSMLYFDEKQEGPAYIREKLDTFCYTSQAGGYITKVVSGAELSPTRFKAVDCPTNRERAERAKVVAEQIGGGVSVEQVGLAYQYTLPYNIFAVVGCRNIAQLLDSVGSCDFDLTAEQIAFLGDDKIAPPLLPQIGIMPMIV